jgi:hypothetical protein
MEIFSFLKNVGAVLATITTLVYASGYLALRARAFTLGTDPAFTLVYEGYVFAGFRFVIISLIILLILSPIIAVLRWGVLWTQDRVPGAFLSAGQWLLLVLIALYTLYITSKILSVNGVLLRQVNSGSRSWIEEAVMGEQMAVILMFVVVFMATISVLWFRARVPVLNDLFIWMLAIVSTIQLFLVPITYGSLYADRKVRVLASIPDAAKVLKEPLGVVDRASGYVTLLGLDKNCERRLVTIKIDDLNGIPVKDIVSLKTFVQNELVHAEKKGEVLMAEYMASQNVTSKHGTDAGKGFFGQLIDYLHVAFENIGSLGDTVVASGQIWSVELDTSGNPSKPNRVSAAGNLAWPVLDLKGRNVYAIQNSRIVRLSDDGQTLTEVDKRKQWIKLFGVTEDGDIMGMISEKGEAVPAILHTDGTTTLTPPPKSDEERERSSLLEQESRAYAGKRSLYVERSTRGGRGFDVFLKVGDEITNLSDCGDDRCGQPSLSPDFRKVLYVRKSRY